MRNVSVVLQYFIFQLGMSSGSEFHRAQEGNELFVGNKQQQIGNNIARPRALLLQKSAFYRYSIECKDQVSSGAPNSLKAALSRAFSRAS